MVHNSDVYCRRGYYPSHNTFSKVQTQGFNTKDSKLKESKPKDSKFTNNKTLTPPYSKYIKLRKTFYIDKKKKYLKKNGTKKTLLWQPKTTLLK